jgi:hypothetical protein
MLESDDKLLLICDQCGTSENVVDISDKPIHIQRGDGELIELFFACDSCLAPFVYRLIKKMLKGNRNA